MNSSYKLLFGLVLVILLVSLEVWAGRITIKNNTPVDLARTVVEAMIEGDTRTVEELYNSNYGFFVNDLDSYYKYTNDKHIKEFTFEEVAVKVSISGSVPAVLIITPSNSRILLYTFQKGKSYFWGKASDKPHELSQIANITPIDVNRMRKVQEGIVHVKQDRAKLYLKPGFDELVLGQLTSSMNLKTITETGDWMQVEAPDGSKGWIPRDWVSKE